MSAVDLPTAVCFTDACGFAGGDRKFQSYISYIVALQPMVGWYGFVGAVKAVFTVFVVWIDFVLRAESSSAAEKTRT